MRLLLGILGLAVVAIGGSAGSVQAGCRCVHVYAPGVVDLWEDACSGGCPPLASLRGNVSDFRAVRYDDGHGDAVHDSVSVIDNHEDGWVVLYEDVGYGGDTICVGPHAANVVLSGGPFNDKLDSMKSYTQNQCSDQPPPVHCGQIAWGWSDGPLCNRGCN